MLDTTPVATNIIRLISTGTTGAALLVAVAHLFGPEPSRAFADPAGRTAGAARGAEPSQVRASIDRRRTYQGVPGGVGSSVAIALSLTAEGDAMASVLRPPARNVRGLTL